MKRTLLAASIVIVAVTSASTAQSPVVNAVVERRATTGDVARDVDALVQQGRTVWVGYRVPILRPRGEDLRATGTCCSRCRLEPATDLTVLAKVAATGLVELRAEPVDCDLDAGGMPLVWLDGVTPESSVAWLATLVTPADRQGRDPIPGRALTALTLHASSSAVSPLVSVARSGATPQLRSRAVVSLAQRAATEAVSAIDAAIANDPETPVKRQAVFALTQLPGNAGIPRLIELARQHPNVEVRRQAIFWLGQSKDPRAIDFFESVLK